MQITRRTLTAGSAALAAPMVHAQNPAVFRFALTPVFLDNDASVIAALRIAFGQDIDLVQWRGSGWIGRITNPA